MPRKNAAERNQAEVVILVEATAVGSALLLFGHARTGAFPFRNVARRALCWRLCW